MSLVRNRYAKTMAYQKFALSPVEVKAAIRVRYNRTQNLKSLTMTIALQPEQEAFVQTQIATGFYANAAEVISEALRLLEKRNHYDQWVETVRNKIDIAADQLDRGEGIDGETVIAQLKEKLQQARES
jgi:antitoxin ParD1/3/4